MALHKQITVTLSNQNYERLAKLRDEMLTTFPEDVRAHAGSLADMDVFAGVLLLQAINDEETRRNYARELARRMQAEMPPRPPTAMDLQQAYNRQLDAHRRKHNGK